MTHAMEMDPLPYLSEPPHGTTEPTSGAAAAVAVSVIVPVTERPAPLADLYEEYSAVLRAAGLRAVVRLAVARTVRLAVLRAVVFREVVRAVLLADRYSTRLNSARIAPISSDVKCSMTPRL